MKCDHCHRRIPAGAEARKMVVEYRDADGCPTLFGYQMPAGPLTAATGRLSRGWHRRCFHIVRKRQVKGDTVTGRVLTDAPTAYTIGGLVLSRDEADALGLSEADRQRGSRELTEHLDLLRAVAATVGKPLGDPEVSEAFAAARHGGPYEHTHDLPLDAYHLRAHLRHAHGHEPSTQLLAGAATYPAGVHAAAHAAAANRRLHTARDDDPGHRPAVDADWRGQTTADLDQLFPPARGG